MGRLSGGRIRFLAELKGVNRFIDGVLKPTARALTPADLEALRQALNGRE